MATSSRTTSSGSGSGLYCIRNSGSEEDRKMKRMESNRESARRSRMRKQKQLDDLTSQLSQLRKENNHIIYSVSITTQHYVSLEAENSVLSAQVGELTHRLQSLNEMIAFMYPTMDTCCWFEDDQYNGVEFVDELMNDPLSYVYANQPILASANMFRY